MPANLKMPLLLAAGAFALYTIQEGSRSTYNIASEQTPLAQAARSGQLALVQLAIENGADVNHRDELMGNTPLHWAVGMESNQTSKSRERVAIVELLLAKGADPKRKNLSDRTPLYDAVWNPELVRALLKGGAEVDAAVGGRTALGAAAYYGGDFCFGANESMRALLEAGADVHAVETGSGWGVLLTAALYGCPDMVRTLLDAGADPNARTKMGKTVLGTMEFAKTMETGFTKWLVAPKPEDRRQNVELIRRAGGRL